MMVNCFCGMVDRRKAFSPISSRDHCQRSSPSRISDTPRAGFEPAQNLSSDFVDWSCAVVITTTPRRQPSSQNENFVSNSKNLLKCGNLTFPVVHYFTWKLEFVSDVLWMIVGHCKWNVQVTSRVADQIKVLRNEERLGKY